MMLWQRFAVAEGSQGYRTFQPGIMVLLMKLFPSVLAKESVKAREFMARGFTEYFKNNRHSEGSSLIKARYEHSMEHKIPVEDIARYEVGGSLAILSNTTPAAFWLIYRLYSNAPALADCRLELSKVLSDEVVTEESGKSVTLRTMDLTKVKSSCPTLISTFQEVLRVQTVTVSTRMVMEDHLLDSKYLLKKGNIVMIPGPVQHSSQSAWGADVDSFDHRRFLPKNKRHSPMAFRAFGGGTTLCPGRHFASTEILAFAAMMIMRFEIKPVGGVWPQLTTENAKLWEAVPMPDQDLDVEIIPMQSESKTRWKMLMTDSDKAMPLAAEDA